MCQTELTVSGDVTDPMEMRGEIIGGNYALGFQISVGACLGLGHRFRPIAAPPGSYLRQPNG